MIVHSAYPGHWTGRGYLQRGVAEAREAAYDRGYSPHCDDNLPGPPLDQEWQEAYEVSVRAAEHLNAEPVTDAHCGQRCEACEDRMCAIDGPAPRACGLVCDACPHPGCGPCGEAAMDAEDERRYEMARER